MDFGWRKWWRSRKWAERRHEDVLQVQKERQRQGEQRPVAV